MNNQAFRLYVISKTCEPCQFKSEIQDTKCFCKACEEAYCLSCARKHKTHRISCDHRVYTVKTFHGVCGPCISKGKEAEVTSLCKNCNEVCCENCSEDHKAQNNFRDHNIQPINNSEQTVVASLGDESEMYPEIVGGFNEKEILNTDKKTELLNTEPKSDISKRVASSNSSVRKESADFETSSTKEKDDLDFSIPDRESKVHGSSTRRTIAEFDSNTVQKTEGASLGANKFKTDLNADSNTIGETVFSKTNEEKKDFVLGTCREKAEVDSTTSEERADFDISTNENANLHSRTSKTKADLGASKDLRCTVESDFSQTNFAKGKTNHREQRSVTTTDRSLVFTSDPGNSKYDDTVEILYERVPYRVEKGDERRKQAGNNLQLRNRGEKIEPDKNEKIEFPLCGGFKEKGDRLEENQKKLHAKDEKMKPRHASKLCQPGKPFAASIRSNCVMLDWEYQNSRLEKEEMYEIFFKETKHGAWKQFDMDQPCILSPYTVTGLRPETAYVFKVRVTNNKSCSSGPFSLLSNVIQTGNAPAQYYKNISERINKSLPAIYQLPSTEDKRWENRTNRIRRFVIGQKDATLPVKTILFVGESGTGKSTLIDSLANYSLGINMEDDYRFTVSYASEKAGVGTLSRDAVPKASTSVTTLYSLHPVRESGFPFILDLIDTPGLDYTERGRTEKRVLTAIYSLLQDIDKIDVFGIVLRASDCRLTSSQRIFFKTLYERFGRHVQQNLCAFVTFCDNEAPPVLKLVTCSRGMEIKKHFTFNNCALFSTETHDDNLKPFWKMGQGQFNALLKYLVEVKPRPIMLTVRQLSVYDEIAIEIQQFETLFLLLLSEINIIWQKINRTKQMFTSQDEPGDYESCLYELQKMPLCFDGQKTLWCKRCKRTCCTPCDSANDIKLCKSMKRNGYCKFCIKQCHYTEHKHQPYIEGFVPVKKRVKHECRESLEDLYNKEKQLQSWARLFLHELTRKHEELEKRSLHPCPVTKSQVLDNLMDLASKQEQVYGSEVKKMISKLFKDEAYIQPRCLDIQFELDKATRVVMESMTERSVRK